MNIKFKKACIKACIACGNISSSLKLSLLLKTPANKPRKLPLRTLLNLQADFFQTVYFATFVKVKYRFQMHFYNASKCLSSQIYL